MRKMEIIFAVVSVLALLLITAGCAKSTSTKTDNRYSSQSNSSVNRTRENGRMGNRMMSGGMMGNGMMENMHRNQEGSAAKAEAWKAPASADNLKNPLKNISEAGTAGEGIFNTQCSTCHGAGGKGDGPAGKMLNPKPADLTSTLVKNESDGALYWKISNGNNPMPAFSSSLSSRQRWELIDYIRTLSKN